MGNKSGKRERETMARVGEERGGGRMEGREEEGGD